MSLPRHIAIIMDGNGRWAEKRSRPRIYGHIKGAQVARNIITEATKSGIKFLTLYTFSTENWKRPAAEVGFLMRLLERHLKRERATLVKQNIRFHVLGDVSRLPAPVIDELKKTIVATEANTGLQLTFALNYGGRIEIVNAAKELARRVKNGELSVEEINESTFALALEGSYMPDPDLIIRTSGEMRLSNFLTWQSSYSELYITPTLWPDFTSDDFHKAILSFSRRDRRFGSINQSNEKKTQLEESLK